MVERILQKNKFLIIAVLLFVCFLTPPICLAGDSFENLIKKGEKAFKNQNYDEALEFFKQGLELNPRSTFTLSNIGSVYFRMNHYKKSKKYYGQVIDLKPNDQYAHFYRGVSCFRLDQLDLAKDHLDVVVSIDPGNEYSNRALQWIKKIQNRVTGQPGLRSKKPAGKHQYPDTSGKSDKDQKRRNFILREPGIRHGGARNTKRQPTGPQKPDSTATAESRQQKQVLKNRFSIGFSTGTWTYTPSSAETFNLSGVNFQASLSLLPFYSLQGRAALTNTDTRQTGGSTVGLRITRFFGVYNKIQTSFENEMFRPYGLIGFGTGTAEVCTPDCSTGSDESLSFGGGLSVFINQNQTTAINLEWLRYLENSNVEVSGFNLGLDYHF